MLIENELGLITNNNNEYQPRLRKLKRIKEIRQTKVRALVYFEN